ncbi:adenylate kinase [Dokdonia sp. Dokd-P16]|uniref:adenylate kinase n=1 Tax=Dokdonia sp. Dokd-P16 TaxID=2173169 RepID=UPI000D544723|nr:adenylate kinase [Dokdonia sp. Dokd-P16]AWH74352.1 adenylate kinase [Dokdonia sp. Dokd-P16]
MKNTITLHDLSFEKFITKTNVQHAVNGVAVRLNEDYRGKCPVFLTVLNGAFLFSSELIKKFDHDCELSFIKVASYEGTQQSDEIHTVMGAEPSLKGRDVIVVEDIVDSGNTVETIIKILKDEEVASFTIATLLYKPEAYKKPYKIDYIGLEVPNDFVVGYGLDYNGLGRNLTSIYKLKKSTMTNLVLFGPPGAGKGTQAEVLKEKYNLVHISTGDLFRYHNKNNTELGKIAATYSDKGLLAPDDLTNKMLAEEVSRNSDANGFIFDGYPRTEDQADFLSKLLKEKNTSVNAMVALEVDDEVLVKRLLERGKTSGRPDDADEEVVRNRIKVYYAETAILKDYYEKQNKYHGVDGVGTVSEITDRLSKVIDTL